MPSLFDPIALGAIHAPNRIIMAPLTRTRATEGHVPTGLMIEYYRQRAGAGLIISEATGISRQGLGWPSAPGLWLDSQVEAWKPVTEAVHRAGGRIVAQALAHGAAGAARRERAAIAVLLGEARALCGAREEPL